MYVIEIFKTPLTTVFCPERVAILKKVTNNYLSLNTLLGRIAEIMCKNNRSKWFLSEFFEILVEFRVGLLFNIDKCHFAHLKKTVKHNYH